MDPILAELLALLNSFSWIPVEDAEKIAQLREKAETENPGN